MSTMNTGPPKLIEVSYGVGNLIDSTRKHFTYITGVPCIQDTAVMRQNQYSNDGNLWGISWAVDTLQSCQARMATINTDFERTLYYQHYCTREEYLTRMSYPRPLVDCCYDIVYCIEGMRQMISTLQAQNHNLWCLLSPVQRDLEDEREINKLLQCTYDSLYNYYTDVSSTLAKRQLRIRELKGDTNNLKNRISYLEDQIRNLQNSLKQRNESIDKLVREHDDLYERNKQLQKQFDDFLSGMTSEEQIQKLKQEKDEVFMRTLRHKRPEKQEIDSTMLKQEIDGLRRSNEQLQNQIDDGLYGERTSEEIQKLKQEKDNAFLGLSVLKQENIDLKRLLQENNENVQILAEEKARLEEKLNTLTKKVETIEMDYKHKKEAYLKLEQDRETLNIRPEELRNQATKYEERLKHSSDDQGKADKLRKRLTDTETDRQILSEQLKRNAEHTVEIRDQRNKHENSLNDLEKQNSQLESKLKGFSDRTRKLEQDKDELLTRINDIEKEKENFTDKYLSCAEETASMKQKERTLNNRIVEIKQQNTDLEERLRHLTDDRGKADEHRKRLNDTEKEKQHLSEQLKRNDAHTAEIRQEKDKLESRLNELQKQNSQLESTLKGYIDTIRKLEQHKDELLTRLSQYTSAQLVHDNPNVADLSDLNRPTKLAEKFSELYDNEWTDAFEVLIDTHRYSEDQAIKHLLETVMTAYTFCSATAKQQIDTLKRALVDPDKDSRTAIATLDLDHVQLRVMQDLRKQTSQHSVESVKQGFLTHLKSTKLKTPDPTSFIKYVVKCAELCWYMVLPSPPLFVASADVKGGVFDKNKYRFYQTSGTKYNLIVWPALFLYKDGNMLSKGIAEAM